MKVYSIAEKHLLFGTGQSTPVTRVMTRRQTNSRYNKNHTQRLPRQRIQAICECCGISGHDVRTAGCDYAASFILTNDF